jgi:hypothetical protein
MNVFLAQEYRRKCAHKMLVKLTIGSIPTIPRIVFALNRFSRELNIYGFLKSKNWPAFQSCPNL